MKPPQHYIVIDDDKTSNLISSHSIRKFSPKAQIVLFKDPASALQFLLEKEEGEDSERNTVVFLDINMPVMSGWDFLEELKKVNSGILERLRIYILSSSIEDFSPKQEKYPFLAGFLSKPLTRDHLQVIENKGKKMHLRPVTGNEITEENLDSNSRGTL